MFRRDNSSPFTSVTLFVKLTISQIFVSMTELGLNMSTVSIVIWHQMRLDPRISTLIKAPSGGCYTWQLVTSIYNVDYDVNL